MTPSAQPVDTPAAVPPRSAAGSPAHGALADRGLDARVRARVAQHGIKTIVETGAGDGSDTLTFARMVPRVLAIEVDRRRAAQLREATAELDNVDVYPGHAPRVIADLRPRIEGPVLWFFDARGIEPRPVRDEVFQVPRGEGVIVIRDAEESDVQDQLVRWSPGYQIDRYVGADGITTLIATPQRRVHVTFLIEKYTHEYGTSGLSINLDNLVATLHQTGHATYDVVHYDEWHHERRQITVAEVGARPTADDHVLVFICHYHSPANPSVELLRAAKESGSKLVLMWLDKLTSVSTPEYSDLADLNVVLDGNDFELPNPWPIFTPKNPLFFHDPGLPRETDLLVLGESRYLKQRRDFLEKLDDEDRINVRIVRSSAADPKRSLSIAEYARALQTTKIALVLTKDAVRQLKGRIFEAQHCGAMLLCDANPHIDTYFTPGVEYVRFDDYEDMIRRCQHLLAHPAELEAIRLAGHRKCVKYYNHDVFWRGLLARVGVTTGAAR